MTGLDFIPPSRICNSSHPDTHHFRSQRARHREVRHHRRCVGDENGEECNSTGLPWGWGMRRNGLPQPRKAPDYTSLPRCWVGVVSRTQGWVAMLHAWSWGMATDQRPMTLPHTAPKSFPLFSLGSRGPSLSPRSTLFFK